MEKMGWKEGQGLGSKCEGRIEPIDGLAKHAEGRRGLGAGRENGRGLAPLKNGQGLSRVLVLRNMVGLEDVDESLEEETRAECQKYGIVERVTVSAARRGSTSDEHAVRIFVAFRDSESTAKALLALNGRFFGGRTVRATFFPEHQFASGNLAYETPAEDTLY